MKHSDLSRKSEQKNNLNTEHFFNSVKNQDYTDSKSDIENWLYKANIQIVNQKEEMKLHRMKNFILTNKLKLVYSVILLFVIAAACNMPVTQTETVGNMLIWTVPAENSDAISKIDNLPWLKEIKFTKNENINNGKSEILYTAFLPNTVDEQVESFRRDLEKISAVTSIKVYPMQENVNRPLYSAALYNFFRININATGMSDEQLNSEVQRQLKEQGVNNMDVQFKTNPDGRRDCMIKIPEGSNFKNSGNFEVNINDGNNKDVMKLFNKKADPEKFKGKTDQEIRDIVRKDLDNPNLRDEEIQITRENGETKVAVEVKREEKK